MNSIEIKFELRLLDDAWQRISELAAHNNISYGACMAFVRQIERSDAYRVEWGRDGWNQQLVRIEKRGIQL